MIRESREETLVRSIIREMLLPKYATTTLSLQIEGFPLGGDWVRDTLGYRIPLNEGPIDEALIRRIVREGLDLSGWLDKTKQLVGMGIDAVKKKVDDAKGAINEFGMNLEGACVALWVAASTGTMGELYKTALKGFDLFVDSLRSYFERARDLLKKVWSGLKGESTPAQGEDSVSEAEKTEEAEPVSAPDVVKDPSSYFDLAVNFVSKVKQVVDGYSSGIAGVLAAIAAALGLRWVWENDKFGKVKTFLKGLKTIFDKGGAKAVKAALGASAGAGAAAGIAWLGSDVVKNFVSDILKEFATNAVITTFAAPVKMFTEMISYVGSAVWAVDTISRIILGKPPKIDDLQVDSKEKISDDVHTKPAAAG